MDCPNCGAYNASNSFRCRRCNHILPSDDDALEDESSQWGPASGPEERWDGHDWNEPDASAADEPEPESEWPDPWTRPDPEPVEPSEWDIAQSSGTEPWTSESSHEQTVPTGGDSYGAAGYVPNYLWPSIGATLCCCAPLGIPAIIYASRVDAFVASGDRAAAEEASNKAKMWALAAFGISILFWIAIFCTGAFTGETNV